MKTKEIVKLLIDAKNSLEHDTQPEASRSLAKDLIGRAIVEIDNRDISSVICRCEDREIRSVLERGEQLLKA